MREGEKVPDEDNNHDRCPLFTLLPRCIDDHAGVIAALSFSKIYPFAVFPFWRRLWSEDRCTDPLHFYFHLSVALGLAFSIAGALVFSARRDATPKQTRLYTPLWILSALEQSCHLHVLYAFVGLPGQIDTSQILPFFLVGVGTAVFQFILAASLVYEWVVAAVKKKRPRRTTPTPKKRVTFADPVSS